ncbi:40367_t:CDS:2 [Gigaspora margarita]|uniref:40367_t:CDS:1 n=1 Tax=Gigaspora margarita TaxID=4874 RepID=A0ABN7UFS9_GIGMA|nr:40367_t:CDS:2 [Gigaspora margarita]
MRMIPNDSGGLLYTLITAYKNDITISTLIILGVVSGITVN